MGKKNNNKSKSKDNNSTQNQINMLNAQIGKYASVKESTTLATEMYKLRSISRDKLRKALSNPYQISNTDILQDASMILKATSGTYRRVLNLISNMNTFDHILYPKDISRLKTKEKITKAYMNSASQLEKYNIKFTSAWITEKVLELGEVYLYKIEDNSGMVLQQIPAKFCMITMIENNVMRYAINIKKLTDKNIISFPEEIKNIYKKYKSNLLTREELIDNTYFQLSDKAVAFNYDLDSVKGVPFFCFIFDDLMELEDMKDLKITNAVIESIKLIHQKIPFGKNDEPLVDLNLIPIYHNSTKANLPKGTAITTNPLELETHTLSDGKSKINDYVKEAKEFIFDNAGINTALLNSDKINNESILNGIIADSLIPMRIQQMIENWVNFELNKDKKANLFNMKFIGTTHFNKMNLSKQYREDMGYGGSKSLFIASTGFTPLQAINTLQAEKLMGFDEFLIPQQTSHTQSSGRPDKSDIGTDNGNSTQAKGNGEND
ncbi:hypothetical protein PV485_16660 [Clostridioides difficile]|nr:hypothetical protein [Clostridioides difficile]MDE3604310.1 hypothetical protein [Clostridioides difficile]